MTESYFSVNKIVIRFVSDSDLLFTDKELLLLHAYIPGLKATAKAKPTFTFKHLESNKQQFVSKGNNYTLFEKWNGKVPLDFYHLLYSIVRTYLLKQNLLSVHAACLQGKKNILLVGPSGVGKTTVLLGLVETAKYLVFSGNKTITEVSAAGKIKALAGTGTITIDKNTKIGMNYGKRNAFILPEEYYSTAKELKIEAIIMPRLNDGVKEKTKLTPISALHNLYPYFFDAINDDTIIFRGNDAFIAENDSKERKGLIKLLSKALMKTPTYKLSGSLEFITKTITTL